MLRHLLFDSSSEDEEPNRWQVNRRRKIFRPRINFNFQTSVKHTERFRMSAEKLDLLLNEIGPLLLHNTSKSGALTPKQQLSVALHWLGCGAQYHIVGDAHGVDKSTVCRTVQRVVNVVNNVLLNRIVRWPENIPNEIEKFYRIARICPVFCWWH